MKSSRPLWPLVLAPTVAVAIVVMLVFVSRPGFGSSGPPALWTDRPVVDAPAALERSPWVELARRLKPAVINVSTTRTEQGPPEAPPPLPGNDPFERFFRQFFGNMPPHAARSLGSGFIINPDGYAITNNHVVDDAAEIRVKLSDGRELSAKVVGRDAKTDLALLKMDATGLPVIPLGDAADVQVGEPVMAIGNPFGLEQTVTTGIVSATGRVIGAGPYDQFIQTDASINPGNSGGPLIDRRGRAIGINTAIFTTNGGSNGIGFAIPISLAKSVITQLAASGHVVRGWLGVTIQPLTGELAKSLQAPDTNGALVASVVKDSPAATAGVKPGDILTEFGGRRIVRSDALPATVAETPVGREVPLKVLRDGHEIVLTAKIGQLAEAEPATKPAAPAKASLGLVVQSLTPQVAGEAGINETRGVLVRSVEDSSRAAKAGIQPGDVILDVDRHPVATASDFERQLKEHPAGVPVLMLVHREGVSMFIAVS